MSTRVLLAADEAGVEGGLSGRLEHDLREHGFEIARPGRTAFSEPPADVVIAGDREELERWCAEAPVIVLGRAEDEPGDRVSAFRQGCDDYVQRPFSNEELIERIRAVVRRTGHAKGRRLVVGELELDEVSRSVSVRGMPVRLSLLEFKLLFALASEPTRVFTRSALLRGVWDWPGSMRTRTVDSHASRLRRKLRALDPGTSWIDNEWGVGYRLVGPYPEQ